MKPYKFIEGAIKGLGMGFNLQQKQQQIYSTEYSMKYSSLNNVFNKDF